MRSLLPQRPRARKPSIRGYGFLSENPDFVEAVEREGLVFIGPSAAAIRAMGLKDAAKVLMEKSGCPGGAGAITATIRPMIIWPGWRTPSAIPCSSRRVAGGGGKGMRLVERPQDFDEKLQSARGEALTAFGNAAVLIEKYILKPRHIEMQVFGDGTRAVHLFERDCSLQRRHQKVIEEAPAPGMTAETRAAMGRAAVRAAEAIGYAGAGTVEFIVDGSEGLRPDRFWFMEMNTRLQVEHPVTEAITGIDLVEWQLRVASGEALPARQEELTITGHAFEARLYAEDVPAGFLPATGRLTHLRFPDGARAETGVRPGDRISPWYDPMIAKIVVHGPTRAAALGQLETALGATEVAGSVTNLAFLSALTRHPGFRRGAVDTGLIARDLDALLAEAPLPLAARALAALGAAGLDRPGGADQGFSLWQPLRRSVRLGEFEAVIEVTSPTARRVTIDGAVARCDWHGCWWVDGIKWPATIARHAAGISVFGPVTLHVHPHDPLDRHSDGPASGLTLSPMPGLVKAVFVAGGQEVRAGDRLAVLEAMKMEHTLTAARAGRVAEVLVAAGSQVEAGQALIRLEEEA